MTLVVLSPEEVKSRSTLVLPTSGTEEDGNSKISSSFFALEVLLMSLV